MSEKPSFDKIDKKPSFFSAVKERVLPKKLPESGETSCVESVMQSVKNQLNRIMNGAKEYVPSSFGRAAVIGVLALANSACADKNNQGSTDPVSDPNAAIAMESNQEYWPSQYPEVDRLLFEAFPDDIKPSVLKSSLTVSDAYGTCMVAPDTVSLDGGPLFLADKQEWNIFPVQEARDMGIVGVPSPVVVAVQTTKSENHHQKEPQGADPHPDAQNIIVNRRGIWSTPHNDTIDQEESLDTLQNLVNHEYAEQTTKRIALFLHQADVAGRRAYPRDTSKAAEKIPGTPSGSEVLKKLTNGTGMVTQENVQQVLIAIYVGDNGTTEAGLQGVQYVNTMLAKIRALEAAGHPGVEQHFIDQLNRIVPKVHNATWAALQQVAHATEELTVATLGNSATREKLTGSSDHLYALASNILPQGQHILEIVLEDQNPSVDGKIAWEVIPFLSVSQIEEVWPWALPEDKSLLAVDAPLSTLEQLAKGFSAGPDLASAHAVGIHS